MTETTIKNIAILMAMQGEATSFLQHFDIPEKPTLLASNLPFKCFQKQIDNLLITLITSGVDARYNADNIGCEPATLMAYESINKLNPDILISAGTAGGFASKNAKIGTVYASEKHFVFHDRIVPMPGFEEAAEGCYPALNVNQLAKDLELKTGVISSGSSLEKNTKDQRVIDKYNAVAKEMEAAAIAWVASLYQTPFFAIKSITNLVDEANQSEDEFIKHFDYSVTVLNGTLIELVDYLQSKTIDDLSD